MAVALAGGGVTAGRAERRPGAEVTAPRAPPLRRRRAFARPGLASGVGGTVRGAGGGRVVGVGRSPRARGLRSCRPPSRPVLKHGPRSLTRARVVWRYETRERKETEARHGRARSDPAPARGREHDRPTAAALSGRPSESVPVGTRKMVNYAWEGRSQRKLWWRTVAILTCKLIVLPGYRGERLIEPSSSWFLPKFPSG